MKNIEKQIEISVCIINQSFDAECYIFGSNVVKGDKNWIFLQKIIISPTHIELNSFLWQAPKSYWSGNIHPIYPILLVIHPIVQGLRQEVELRLFVRSLGYLIKLSVIFWTCLSPSTSPLINFIRLGTPGFTNEWYKYFKRANVLISSVSITKRNKKQIKSTKLCWYWTSQN